MTTKDYMETARDKGACAGGLEWLHRRLDKSLPGVLAAIALDLEFEQPNREPDVTDSHTAQPEIIQVGRVVFDPLSNPDEPHVLSVRREHVQYPRPLSTFIKKLTVSRTRTSVLEDCWTNVTPTPWWRWGGDGRRRRRMVRPQLGCLDRPAAEIQGYGRIHG